MTEHFRKFTFLSAVIVMFACGCSQSIILLSPEDHYALGNYYLEKNNREAAKKEFELIRDKYPTSEFTTMSQFKLAETQFKRKRYLDAAADFEIFLEFHPAHKLAPYAQFHLALCKFKSMLSPERDPTLAHEALEACQKFLRLYPEHPDAGRAREMLHKIQDHLAEHELQVGLVYYRRKYYSAALNRIEPVVDGIHDAKLKTKAAYIAGRCHHKIKEYDQARKWYTESVKTGGDLHYGKRAAKFLRKLPPGASPGTKGEEADNGASG